MASFLSNPTPPAAELDYKRLFEAIPGAYLVLTPGLTIVAVSDQYLEVSYFKREALIGRSLFDALTDNPNDPAANGVPNLRDSLQRVLAHRQPDAMPVQRYDIQRPASAGGGYEVRYWSPINSPVLDDQGQVILIIHRVEDVTEFVRNQIQLQPGYNHGHVLDTSEIAEADLIARVRAVVDLNRKLTTTNQLLQVEIAERLGAEQRLQVLNAALTDAKAAADAASKAKSNFLATMSHEIRTPLNGVMGMLDLLMGTALNEKQRQYASLAHLSAESLTTIISDILDFSKIEAGKLELAPINFNLHHTVEDVMAMLAQAAMRKGLEIACHIAPDVPTHIHADDSRLRQVLINLVNNAIKFTQQGSVVLRVTLDRLRPDDVATIRLSITDTGIGIPQDRCERLFQPFTQADASTTRTYGGTGLGLAISRELVMLMDGQIGVDSHVGQGSTFWFTLQAPRHVPKAKPPTPRNRLDPATLRILVVDDSEIQRHVLCQQIGSWGLNASCAANGSQALRLMSNAATEEKPFKVAIVDQDMPDMDGVAFASAVRGQDDIRETVLMILLAVENNLEPEQLRSMGFSGQMTKPVRQSQLFDAIMTAIAASDLNPAPEPTVEEMVDATAAPTALVKPQPPAIHGPCHILVVEDNEINRIVAQEVLSRYGCSSDAVPGGAQALQAVRQKHYDAILMDCHMPEMDGLEATRRIRQLERDGQTHGQTTAAPDGQAPSQRVPIIALTANAMEGKSEDCLAAGMDAYTRKPINTRHLMQTILSVLPASFHPPSKPSGSTSAESPAVAPAGSADPSPSAASPASAPAACAVAADPATVAAPSANEAAPPIDISRLLTQCMGNRSLAKVLLEKLQGQLQADERTFDALHHQWDTPQAAQAAHTLKGAASAVGAGDLSNAAAKVEHIARHLQCAQAPAALAALKTQIVRCAAFIPTAQAVLDQSDGAVAPAPR